MRFAKHDHVVETFAADRADESRSRMRYRGARSHGNASVTWREIHSAVGFAAGPGFRFQRCSRLEARSQDTENQPDQIGHQDASLRRPLAASTPNRLFGTHREATRLPAVFVMSPGFDPRPREGGDAVSAATHQAARAARSKIQAGISSHRPDARPERLQRKTSPPAFSTTS